METTGLYVHVPFCTGKCNYCSFYSVAPTEEQLVRYLHALEKEANLVFHEYFDPVRPRLESIYIGGGTPTRLEESQLEQLALTLRKFCLPTDGVEYTVETSPETTTAGKLAVLRRAEVNRMSLGVQSFDDERLAALGRRHRAEDSRRSVREIRSAGIEDLSIDLIYGTPDQSLAAWRWELERAVELGPEHVACYELTLEAGTPAWLWRDRMPEEGLLIEMYYLAEQVLSAGGYRHYEISNYARPGYESWHNLRYWHNLSYIGLGPSAAGYLGGVRYTNVADLEKYDTMLLSRGHRPVESAERPAGLLLAGETAMLNLRMRRGIDRREFMGRTGFDPFAIFAERLDRLREAGLIETDSNHIRLSRKGLVLSNEVMAEFLP